ncbi:hypothetical protein HF292_005115 [Acidithiobacillus ferruginosus]|uniref:Uncharacterized protein n=1 Tax=Acidithiobacillus ferruginosus TaxID=3063951 RepID=A0ACD5IJT4_9PROT
MLDTDPDFRYNGRYGNGKIFQFAPRQYPGTPNQAQRGSPLSGVDGGAHYLGAVPRIGETLWYVATWQDQWVALISMSGAALKCAVRDLWIGLDFRSQYGRLRLHHYKIPSWNCKVWSASSTNTLLVI